MISGGKVIIIPPRSPSYQLVEAAAALASINDSQLAPALKTAAQADIYAKVAAEFAKAASEQRR